MAEMKKKPELIFIPAPGIGHLASSLEFAKLLISRDSNLSITVLCIKFPSTTFSDSYIKSFLFSKPQIQLIDLPEVDPPQQDLWKSPEFYVYVFMERLIPHVKATIQNILSSNSSSNSNPVVGLVLDFFCISMIDVGIELGIPSYLFMTSNLGFLGLMLSLKNRGIQDVFSDSDSDLLIPGFSNLVPSSVLPEPCFNKDGGYVAYYMLAKRFRETKGMIVNTFSELEQYAIHALLSDGQTPPIYAVGPLIDLKGQHDNIHWTNPKLDQAQRDNVLKWLDEQPPSSVVFLCFGSMGISFGPSQTREMALALQNSGFRFLWAMNSPPTKVNAERTLPEGFLEWMELEGKGMICGWAPQIEVLAHRAIGGFVSHCGWNSILESLWFGVPILTWPIYAEQQLNAFRMVREWGLAVELTLKYRSGDLVMAEEIQKGLKQLMDRDHTEVHKKVQQMKDMARVAVLSGGSSFISVQRLIDDIRGNN